MPKVDECVLHLARDPNVSAPASIIKSVVQSEIEYERKKILESGDEMEPVSRSQWLQRFIKGISRKLQPNLKKVYNGTGVVIHTNLGRSVLSTATTDRLVQAGGFYSNLEFNLQTGKRGSRYSLVEEIICELTGAEAALVVNNNAAAVLIALETLVRGKEVVVSRGQLVEIGGSFRIPDIMAKSGATLREVGATNRTHLYDYENAITEQTAMLLRVHTSNFRIIGFTKQVSAEEMAALAKENNLITMEDLGSGSLIDFSQFGFPKEPTVQEIVKAGIDVVTFSGDKLLGGPQAGIIVGNRDVISKIKKNPLNRALRIDKFTLAALESVLREYYDLEEALQNIPTLAMLTISSDRLKKRAQKLLRRIKKQLSQVFTLSIVPTVSRVGGGALPEYSIPSWALSFQPVTMKLHAIESILRTLDTPVIGRIENEHYLIDLRTIQDSEIPGLAQVLIKSFVEYIDNA